MKNSWLIWLLVAILSLPVIVGLQSLLLELPAPFRNISVPLLVLSLGLLIWKSGAIVWYAAALYGILDWYTATPYGLVLYSGTLAMLAVVWLYRAVITNQGILAAALVTAALTTFFNVFYAFGRAVLSVVNDTVSFPGAAWLTTYLSQMVITVVTAVLIYLILVRIIPALKVTHTRHLGLYV